MPPSLRKSCHACMQAKRRCLPQLPACDRCTKKGISCTYDLEPVARAEIVESRTDPCDLEHRSNYSASTGLNNPSQPLNIIYNSVSAARDASTAAMASGQTLSSAETRPMLMSDGEIVDWITKFFIRVARDGLEYRKSPFIHRRIIRHELKQSKDSVSHQLNETDEEQAPYLSQSMEVIHSLEEIQDLIISILRRLLLEKLSTKKDIKLEELVRRMFDQSHALWSSAPQQLSNSFKEWDLWVIAESIRRSMFSAILIRGLWHAATNGFVYYEPFFESIPFDPRAGLWEAETDEEWRQLIKRYGGEHTKLKSYHEFVSEKTPKLDVLEDGDLQRLLFVCFHGNRGLQELNYVDEPRSQLFR